MGNCLVTKLKATVDNNNLLPMGVVRVNVEFDTPNTNIYIGIFEAFGATKDVILTIVGDAKWVTGDSHFTWISDKKVKLKPNQHYYNYNGSGGMRTLTVVTDNVASGSFYVDIENKYELNVLNLNGLSTINNTEELEYAQNLEILVLTGNSPRIQGNIAYFNKLTLLTSLSGNIIGSSAIGELYGDIASLNAITSLTEVKLSNNNGLYGDIGVFANAPGITNLLLNGCNKVSGRIEQLGGLVNLTELRLTDSNVNGNLNDMLDALHTAGKSDGALIIFGKNTKMEYTGTKDITVNDFIRFTFSASGWTEIV